MMQQVELGKTKIYASRLCFGTLTLSPLQCNLSVSEGADLMRYAFDQGINFLDTAELYDNYEHIGQAIQGYDHIVVSTKCYAYDETSAQISYEKAVKSLNREYIDIFMLHEQESEHTLRGHAQALEFFLKKKEQGYIGALGISTHYLAGVIAAKKHPLVEIIHPIFNLQGIGILDGTQTQMEEELKQCSTLGKGILAMKPLGGGHLIKQKKQALDYVLKQPYLHSVAMGMQSKAEIDYNVAFFSGRNVDDLEKNIRDAERKLLIHDWCTGCGKCVAKCHQHALQLQNCKAVVDQSKCVLCGYCATACFEFCIKVI